MSPRRVEIRTHVGYGRRVEPDPTAHATDDPAAAHARWVQEQKRRNAVRGAEDIPADDPRWSRLAFFESIMVGVAERIAERKRVHVTLNGEPLEQVRARVRLRVAPDRPSDAQRLRFARRATKILRARVVAVPRGGGHGAHAVPAARRGGEAEPDARRRAQPAGRVHPGAGAVRGPARAADRRGDAGRRRIHVSTSIPLRLRVDGQHPMSRSTPCRIAREIVTG